MNAKYYGEQVESIDPKTGFRGLRYRYIMVKGHTATVITKRLTLAKETFSVQISIHPAKMLEEEIRKNYIPMAMDAFIGSANLAIEWTQNVLSEI